MKKGDNGKFTFNGRQVEEFMSIPEIGDTWGTGNFITDVELFSVIANDQYTRGIYRIVHSDGEQLIATEYSY